MAICARALVRKNEWRARERDKRASERTLFLFAYRVCMRKHALLFFFSPLRRPMYKGYIVFQACSRRFTSIYYSFTNERKEKEKRMSSKLSDEYESG
jgi:hypothetical protein